MTRNDVFLAVIGGADLYAGLSGIDDALKDADASSMLGHCLITAWGVLCISLAYAARRRAERSLKRDDS